MLQDNSYLTHFTYRRCRIDCGEVPGPKNITAIGVIGTGEQARMQVDLLKDWTDCRQVYAWGRIPEKSLAYKHAMEEKGFVVHIAASPAEVAQNCNLIITATSSREPLLKLKDIRPGTHITAMGADAPE